MRRRKIPPDAEHCGPSLVAPLIGLLIVGLLIWWIA